MTLQLLNTPPSADSSLPESPPSYIESATLSTKSATRLSLVLTKRLATQSLVPSYAAAKTQLDVQSLTWTSATLSGTPARVLAVSLDHVVAFINTADWSIESWRLDAAGPVLVSASAGSALFTPHGKPTTTVYAGQRAGYAQFKPLITVPGRALAVAADDSFAAVVGRHRGRVDVLRVQAASRAVAALAVHRDEVTHAVFVRGTAALVTAGRDGRVVLSSVLTGRVVARTAVRAAGLRPSLVSVSDVQDGGAVVVTTVWDGLVHRWTVALAAGSGQELAYLLDGEDEGLRDALAVSADGRLVLVRADESIEVLEAATGHVLAEVRNSGMGTVMAGEFAPDGKRVAVSRVGGRRADWSVEGWVEVYELVWDGV